MRIEEISNHEPYFAVLDHPEKTEVIEYAKKVLSIGNYEFIRGKETFKHCRLVESDCTNLLQLTPLRLLSKYAFEPYASIFSTAPGEYYRAHKDGQTIRFALNYIIEANDKECVTSWYSDDVDKAYDKDLLNGASRELVDFAKESHQPLLSTVFAQDQCILFNTDIYHDFDNRTSSNWRHILTIRFSGPKNLYWSKARSIILEK